MLLFYHDSPGGARAKTAAEGGFFPSGVLRIFRAPEGSLAPEFYTDPCRQAETVKKLCRSAGRNELSDSGGLLHQTQILPQPSAVRLQLQ